MKMNGRILEAACVIDGRGPFFGISFRLLDFVGGYFFEKRILLQFLFNQRFQFQRSRLQQSERLLQLRRQHLREGHPLR